MAVKERTEQQYEVIRAEYSRLLEVSEFGAKKYTHKWIIAKLARKFFKSPRTIEKIVYHRDGTLL
ncbi:MAG: hypothetical protein V6Z82_02500 [Flavobacteriales bacterium]